MTLAFTLCSNNYLAQAITLGNSLLRYNPGYTFVIGLVDRKNDSIDYSTIPHKILEVENIGIPAFEELYEKYNVTELNTAVKPFYFRYFFTGNENPDNVIYLDPDILVYSPFTVINKDLESSEIIIIPHLTVPISDNKLPDEEDILNAGLYNLGFIAIKNSAEGNKMVDWWAERLQHKACIDLKRGLFTDQKWINFVPLFFNKVKVLDHPGYNMAYWNLHERGLSKKVETYFVNEKYPLVFYHFSGFSPLLPDILSKYQNRFSFQEIPAISEIFKEYSELLFQNKYKTYINYPNKFVRIKKLMDEKHLLEEKSKIPLYKRALRKMILKLISKFDIIMDYSGL